MKDFGGYADIGSEEANKADFTQYCASFKNTCQYTCCFPKGIFFQFLPMQKSEDKIKESLGLTVYKQSHATIVGDIFIANRIELGKMLVLSAIDITLLNDPELFLQCYLLWGKECLQKIVGEFSFAIWDEKKNELFCAVDPLGVRSFFYRKQGETGIQFSCKLAGIVASSQYTIEIGLQYLADYLLGVYQDSKSTVYSDILRIVPGTYLVSNVSGTYCEQYWFPEISENYYQPNSEDFSEQLKELIKEAVHCRIGTGKKQGVLLSGGLDSSTVTCIAQDILKKRGDQLFAFAQVLPDNCCDDEDEKEFVEEVAQFTDIKVQYSTKTNGMSQQAFDAFFQSQYTLPPHPFLCTTDPMHQTVSKANLESLLTGYGGDNAASNHGEEYFAFLAKKGHLIQLFKLLIKTSNVEGVSFGILLKRRVIIPLIPFRLLEYYRRVKGKSVPCPVDVSLIKKELIHVLHLEERSQAQRAILHGPSSDDPRSELVVFLKKDVLRQLYDIDGYLWDRYSLSCRHPLLDKRIIDFILKVPPDELVKDGWSRSLFRRAIAGIVPEKIQFRKGKTSFCQSSKIVQLAKSERYVNEILAIEKTMAWDIIDREKAREKFDSFLKDNHSITYQEALSIGRCVTVAAFLQWHGL